MALPGAGFNLDDLERIELKGFQTNGISQAKRGDASTEGIAWRIRGEGAVIQKPNYTLNGFEMTLDGTTDSFGHYLLESPKCIYNHDAQQVRGDGAVLLHGPDNLSVSGIGYDFYWNPDQEEGIRLVIRDAVHIELELGSIQKWKSTPIEPFEVTP
ncbi:MAG: hypothetical protein MJ202_07185 [Lentisphaeria bacterium]|nr:hypothetical protein [Lentisphaeria bacterium]